MKEKIKFFGKFFLFSAILFALWVLIGRYYLIFLAQISTPLLHLLGYPVTLIINEEIFFSYLGATMNLTESYLTNYNLVPFLALVFATPFNKWRMGKSLLIGLPIIFIFHLIDIIAHFPLYYDANAIANFITALSAITRLFIPFLIWFALSYDYILQSFRSHKKIYQCPICGKHTHGIMMHIRDTHKNMNQEDNKKITHLKRKYPELHDHEKKKHILKKTMNKLNKKNNMSDE